MSDEQYDQTNERDAALIFKKNIQDTRAVTTDTLKSCGMCHDALSVINGYASHKPEIYDRIIQLANDDCRVVHKTAICDRFITNVWTLSIYTSAFRPGINPDFHIARFEVLSLRLPSKCITKMCMVDIRSDLDNDLMSFPEYQDILYWFSQMESVCIFRANSPDVYK